MSELPPTPDRPPQYVPATPTVPSAAPNRKSSVLLWVLGGIAALVVVCGATTLIGTMLVLRSARISLQQTASSASLSAPKASRSERAQQIYDVEANAKQYIADALQTAKAEHKRVLIDFGADWCPDCVVLAGIFEDPKVQSYLDEHFVVVRVNVGQWDANLDVSKQYGDPIANGIPAVVVLDSDKTIVASTGGGELANARTATDQDILALLRQWAEE